MRGNDDAEVCPMQGCIGKMQRFRTTKKDTMVTKCARYPESKTDEKANALDDPERPCAFMGRDGLPCRRAAIVDGGCRLHAKEANARLAMIGRMEANSVAKETSVQVPPDDTRTTKTHENKKIKDLELRVARLTEEKKKMRDLEAQVVHVRNEAERMRVDCDTQRKDDATRMAELKGRVLEGAQKQEEVEERLKEEKRKTKELETRLSLCVRQRTQVQADIDEALSVEREKVQHLQETMNVMEKNLTLRTQELTEEMNKARNLEDRIARLTQESEKAIKAERASALADVRTKMLDLLVSIE